MNESEAWLLQGICDHEAALALDSLKRAEFHCQVIAKWQQSVEKMIKGLVAALTEAKILGYKIGYKHEAMKIVTAMLHLPRHRSNHDIQNRLCDFFDGDTRAGIQALDRVVPRRPTPGNDPERNTEYPFRASNSSWSYPAQPGVFSDKKFERFRFVANSVRKRAPAIATALRHKP